MIERRMIVKCSRCDVEHTVTLTQHPNAYQLPSDWQYVSIQESTFALCGFCTAAVRKMILDHP